MLPPPRCLGKKKASICFVVNVLLLVAATLAFSSHQHIVTVRPQQHVFRCQEIHPSVIIGPSKNYSRRTMASPLYNSSERLGSSSASKTFKQVVFNVVTLIVAQSTLIPIAFIIAEFLHLPNSGLGSQFQLGQNAILSGLRWTIPLFGVAGLLRLVEPYSKALQDVTKATHRSVLSVLGSTRRPLFALLVSCLLGAAAGIGEEWLFRGVFQEVINQNTSPIISLVLSGGVFGILHAVTPVYFLLAFAASVYFGYLYIITHNLAVPMITHAVYDVFALMWAHLSVTSFAQEEIDEILNFSGTVAPILSAKNVNEEG